jgi:hypothetical protein
MTDRSAAASGQWENIVGLPEHADEESALIPEGEYRLKLVNHHTAVQFGTPKLILIFEVTDFGPLIGTKLKAFFNVAALNGKAGAKGKVKHKRTGDFMIQYFTVFPTAARIKRLDRVPMEPLYNIEIVCNVRTVKLNSNRLPLPEQLWYSKVERLVRAQR